jgi:hypothetical protein
MRRAPAAVFNSPLDAKRRPHTDDAANAQLEFAEARLPGPSDYDITNWRTDHSPSYSFGGQGIRTRKNVAKRADVSPGPASYGVPRVSVLSKGLAF